MLACLYYVAYNRHFIHMKRYCFIIYLRGVLPPVAQCKHICMKEMMQNDTFDKMRIQTSLYIFANMIIYMHFISISQFRFMFSTLQRQQKRRQTWWLGSTECVRSRWLYIALQVCFIMNEWKIMRHWGHIGCYISLSHEIVAYSNADDCVDHRVYSNWRTRHINT